MTDERLTIWMGFVKFLLGTFAIGLATLLINSEIQEREVELKEMEMIGNFVEYATSEEIDKRLRFAHYFSIVTRSDDRKTGWESYFKSIQDEVELKRKSISDNQDRLASINDAVKKNELETEILKLKAEIAVPEYVLGQSMVRGLLAKIDKLSSEKAIELEANVPTTTQEIEQLVANRDQAGKRLGSGDFAKEILKMRLVYVDRDENSLKAWEAAIKAALASQ